MSLYRHSGKFKVNAICAAIATGLSVIAQAKVVINEIFYNAPDEISRLQWIELHNTDSAAADVSGWKLASGVEFEFPPDYSIPGNGFVVLCQDAKRFREYYAVAPAGEFKKSLRGAGEAFELQDKSGKRVDRVRYSSAPPWPMGPDGNSASLERITPDADGTLPQNWASSRVSADRSLPGGSPGRQNDSYSRTLPPTIEKVSFAPVSPKPGESIQVNAMPAGKQIKKVELLYSIVRSTNTSAEASVEMKLGEGNYVAQIPGQQPGALVRFRVRAVDADGAERSYPSITDVRPALSLYVPGEAEPGTIPLAYVINTNPRDALDASRYIERAKKGSGSPFGPNSSFQVQQMLDSRLDLESAWTEVTVNRSTDASKYPPLRALFQKYATERDELRALAESSPGGLNDMGTRAQQVRDRFLSDVRAALPDSEKNALDSWEKGNRGSGPEGFFKNLLKIEGAWLALNRRFELSQPQFEAARPVLKKALEGRSLRNPELSGLQPGPGSFPRMQAAFGKVENQMWAELRTVLSYPHTRYLQDWVMDHGSFIRPRASDPRPLSAQGSSALVIVDPETRKTEVFDFINISERSAGFKVRFHKDHTFRGLNTVNLIFEYNDRFVLAEPLAFDLYRRLGCPAPITDFLRLTLDGQPAGYHLAFEQINRSFLRRNKRNDDGDLYKIAWYGRSIQSQHEKQTNPDSDHSELLKLVDQLNQTSGDEQWRVIQNNFNVDEVINYFAANMCLSHWDGFFNNYFTYHDKKGTGKWEMYPWDQDKTWGFYDSIKPGDVFYNMPLTFGMAGDRPPGGGPAGFNPGSWWREGGFFSKPLLANPEFRKRFLRRMSDILDKTYTTDELFPAIDALGARLRPEVTIRAKALGHNPAESLKRLDGNLASLKENLTKRREFLLNEPEIKKVRAEREG